ncbi:hypothetical protein BOTBODRAFT_26590 [Botryobasidium botryosum FD-172 SS1]|uniref:Exocyst complex component SEC15 n=1 Tax=Botryobasidium botryosum (strain FD-172 SS1) TaxID=930990 RepID=A0A067N9W5_BOTB1|nr:hypothetical protein BOTBODRAFT_26590 [Botryobasidium botryosum FD-172 SS1]
MPPRRKTFTQESIDTQLQSIHLLDASSITENLEALGPIIKSIHETRQIDAYLRTLQGLIESKDSDIEKICGDNYQDFVSSVSTILTVRSYTVNLRDRITTLDGSVSAVGHGLAAKKKALLQSKQTANNLDEAIDTLQGCLRVLDLVNSVGDMIKDGKYWSALRSLEEIQSLPSTSLSQTPLLTHLLSSLPSLRSQIKDAVTASTKSWLLEVRNVSGQIGKMALDAMRLRNRRWRSRKDKEPMLKLSRVGSAVEVITNEKNEFDPLNNDTVKVDFKPLYQCIHIYGALSALPELQKSYQADRKAQAALLLSANSSLTTLTAELLGFFIIEHEVLRTTRGFRSKREVEELWEEVVARVVENVNGSVASEKDPEVFLKVKDALAGFIHTLEAYEYPTAPLESLTFGLFEKYTALIETKFDSGFDKAVTEDDHQPMEVRTVAERERVLGVCWLKPGVAEELFKLPLPLILPFSQTFHLCCTYIREFVELFYRFIDGIYHHHRSIDELLQKSLDRLLIQHVSDNITGRVGRMSNLSQIAQVVTNVEHFEVACAELDIQLTKLRSTQRGGQIRLQALPSFVATLTAATTRLSAIIQSKLDDFFELSEYDFTPPTAQSGPSMYLYELVNWLVTVVDSLVLDEKYKDAAFKSALEHVAHWFMDFVFGRNIPMINQNGVANILLDVAFLESEFQKLGKAQLAAVFTELRLTTSIPLNDAVSEFLQPSARQSQFVGVDPKKLAMLLEKLSRYGVNSRSPAEREQGDRRKREADAVSRIVS